MERNVKHVRKESVKKVHLRISLSKRKIPSKSKCYTHTHTHTTRQEKPLHRSVDDIK